jgi:acetylornithine/N-succinyldiaminopimelate aminotransferase
VESRPIDFSGSFENFFVNSIGASDEAGLSPEAAAQDSGADALAAKLVSVSFGDRVFLSPSAPEAWRTAIETMRRYHQIVGRPKRRRLILCLGAEAQPETAPFGLESDPDITISRADDLGALRAEIDPRTAGFLIAPVRTQNSLEVLGGSLLAGLRESADEYGLVLAFDETFCGLGRTGMIWAHEWTGVTPDLMISTAGLAGAQPLAALIMTQKVARGAPPPLPEVDPAALAAGNAMMDALLAPGFEERVQNRAWRLEDRLSMLMYQRRDVFKGLCGIGLMQGLVCFGEAEPMRAKLAECGLLTRAMGPVLGLFPSLAVADSEIDDAVSRIAAVFSGDES